MTPTVMTHDRRRSHLSFGSCIPPVLPTVTYDPHPVLFSRITDPSDRLKFWTEVVERLTPSSIQWGDMGTKE